MRIKKARTRHLVAALSVVSVAGSLLLAAPAVAATDHGSVTPSAEQWDGRQFSFRPRLDAARSLDGQGTVNTERGDEAPRRTFVPHLQANGWYTLSNPTRSNVVLGWNRVDQAPVFVSTTSGSAAQREWQFVRQSNGSYEIRSRDGGEKLNFFEHNNGVVVAPPTVTGGSVQWFISPIGGALVNGAHYFFSWRANPQYALNVDSAPAATIGANAVLARAFANPTQWWRVEYNSVYGMYQVRNLNNLNAVLEWNVTTNRAVLGGSRGTWEQLWMVRPGLNGGWELINLAHGGVRALDNNNSVSGDAAVNVTTYTGSAGQEWGLSAPQR